MNQAWLRPPVPEAAQGAAPQTPAIVPRLLRDYGAATHRAVAQYLARSRPAPYLDALVADYPQRGGKMLRSTLCIATARMFGASLADSLPAAAAIELFHNALLIHDDIQDGSEVRRGRPTLHVAHGVPLAINAGDALMLLALEPLLDSARLLGEGPARHILSLTQIMARETAEGQALELGWRDANRTDLTEADYLTIALKKTAWMTTIWPIQLGIAIGARGRPVRVDPEGVIRFGFFLGAAFQIQDDLLNLVADAAYGKECGGDLFEGKRTLMLIHLLQTSRGSDRAALDAFLALDRSQRTQVMVEEIVDLMERHGSVTHAREVAGAMAGAAAHEFSATLGHLAASPDRDFLEGLIPWVFERI